MNTTTRIQPKPVLIYPRVPDRLPALSMAMGPFYIGSYIANYGYDATLLDANNFPGHAEFLAHLEQVLGPDTVVGISVMTSQIPSAIKISEFIKLHYPDIPVVWGGVHPSLFPEQTARHRYVDYAVRGEGEIVFLELLQAFEGKRDISVVNGIAYAETDGKIIVNDEGAIPDINDLPPLRWELLETISPGKRFSLPELARLSGKGMYLQTSRGCPHRCSFCINSVLKIKFRDRRSDLVLDDVQRLVEAGVDSIWFMDEIFFANKKRVREILDGIENRGLAFKWFADIRADYFNERHVDAELVSRMKQSGCQILGIGAESGSLRILEILTKDITVDNTMYAAEILTKTGIKANFSFMTGLPGEQKDDILQTLRLINDITTMDKGLSFRILGPQVYRPYPGSELYRECLNQGMKQPDTIEEWAASPYIRSETIVSHRDYPWIHHSIRFINNVVFYGSLCGIRLQYGFITQVLRRMARFRCRHLWFTLPFERWAYNIMIKTGGYKLLSIRNVFRK